MLAKLKESGRGGSGGSTGASLPTISASNFGAAFPAGSISTSQSQKTRRISSINCAQAQGLDVIDSRVESRGLQAFPNQRIQQMPAFLQSFLVEGGRLCAKNDA